MPSQYVRAAFRSSSALTGQLVVNVLHWEVDTLTSPADFTGIATDIATHFQTTYLNMLSTHHIWHDVTVTEETYPGSVPAQGIHSLELTGTRTAVDTGLAEPMCALLSLHTGTPKRYARGHMFVPPALGSNELGNNGSFLAAGNYGLAAAAFAASLKSSFNVSSTTYGPIVFSRTRAKQALVPFQFPVTNVSVSLAQHWLRKRATGA